MRVGPVLLGVLLLARAGVAIADCGDGLLDVGEQCDDGNTVGGDCCSADCQFEPGGSPCPDDGNPCTFDACNSEGMCQHPPGNLDVVCRPKGDACDVAETCNGRDPACPPDGVEGAGVACRAAAGVCDVAETCDGVSPGCPADLVRPAGVECRAASGPCDVAEACDGLAGDCPPDAGRPDGTPCNDGNGCTGADACQGRTCTGTPLACVALDACHVAGICDAGTGVCSNPPKADNAGCDDRNACTTADSCHAGVCQGLTVAGCCVTDAECADAFGCTEDRCTANACVHVAVDDRCGAAGECGRAVCVPGEAQADARGCLIRAVDESTYCTEDDDPCTIDACRTGLCEHDADGSGPRCPLLVAPFRTALGLLARARQLRNAFEAAVACTRDAGAPACDVTAGQDAARLVALLQATEMDLQTAALAISGRLAGSSSPETPRDPTVRAQLALGLLASTPGDLRAFLATLRQARAAGTIRAQFARTQRSEGTRLLRGTVKLRGQLNRIVARRRSFAR